MRNDSFTPWSLLGFDDLLALHMVDKTHALAAYREASERKPDSSKQKLLLDRSDAVQPERQVRLSVYNWNPGPRRGNADAFVKQIAGKWHIITLQEATDYIDSGEITERFHISHFGGCAVLFNKDTFYSEVEASSVYLHDTRREERDQAAEGGQGWVMSGVLARATFKRQAANGQKHFTVLCLHICNIFAKKRGIAKKLILTIRTIMTSQHVDLVAGDFNGTAWRNTSMGNLTRNTIEEASSDTNLPTPPGPPPLWGLGSIPDLWSDVCGFLKPPESHQSWKVRKHGAFAIPRKTLGLRDQDRSSHHETWLHLELVEKRDGSTARGDHCHQRIQLRERTAPYQYVRHKKSISDIWSDETFSS